MRLPVVLVALLALGGAAAWWSLRVPAEGGGGVPEQGLYTVRRGTLTVTLTESGTLVAKESRPIAAEVRGSAKITFLVDEGSQVQEGDVVCRLDATELEDRLEQVELEVVQAAADLDTAQTELEIQEADNLAAVEKSRIALDKARQELERYADGDAPKERRNLEVAIKEAETEYTRSKKRFEDSQLLMSKNYINKSQLEEDEIKYERATVQLESARRDLELFEQYTFPMTMAEREVAVVDAEREVETVSKRADSNLRQRQVAVETASKRLEKLQKQVNDLQSDIGKMVLIAPSPGLVIYGDPQRQWWRRSEVRVGGEVWGDMTILTIPDLRVMQVRVRVHEADVSKVAVGQAAKITMDTYPGLVIDGTVAKIAGIASGDNPREQNPEVKKFDVEILLSGTQGLELKPGISAKAEVFIDRRTDVLAVPLQSVFLQGGKHWCYVLGDGGAPMPLAVETGLSNDSHIEIVSGLEEGQRVLLYNPSLAAGRRAGEQDDEDDEADEDGEDADEADVDGGDEPQAEPSPRSGDDEGGEGGDRRGPGGGGRRGADPTVGAAGEASSAAAAASTDVD